MPEKEVCFPDLTFWQFSRPGSKVSGNISGFSPGSRNDPSARARRDLCLSLHSSARVSLGLRR
jgi:hypothetical protein